MAHYKGAATEATRAMNIMKKREKAREELELKKRKIEEGDIKLNTIDSKFSTHHHDAIESQLRSSTVGLVTLDQMREKQETALKEREKQLAHKEEDRCRLLEQQQNTSQNKTEPKNKKSKSLSFNYGDDDEDDDDNDNEDEHDGDNDIKDKKQNDSSAKDNVESSDNSKTTSSPDLDDKTGASKSETNHNEKSDPFQKKGKTKLNVATLDIDTSFLPDREREEEERVLREKLASDWREQQRKLKEEEIEITFSYWDGSGHRRMVRMKKGNSIYQFLHAGLETLRKDFNELRSVSADQLMYVKEDLIIPQHYTFYDFIVTKARGKSGPLFSFDVHDDVRLIADATVEKDESHAGKVLLRSWYERNKHIFPASRWEPYDPTKTYEKYTISDKRT